MHGMTSYFIRRLLLVPVFLWLLHIDEIASAGWLLAFIGATDWVDGFLARRLGQESELGRKLDPIADRLAKEGIRFTSFYAQTVCGPSRSALLTGRYPIRSKGWGMPASEITFAELMRESGYQTACIGKWDVSNRKPIIDRMPNAQ